MDAPALRTDTLSLQEALTSVMAARGDAATLPAAVAALRACLDAGGSGDVTSSDLSTACSVYTSFASASNEIAACFMRVCSNARLPDLWLSALSRCQEPDANEALLAALHDACARRVSAPGVVLLAEWPEDAVEATTRALFQSDSDAASSPLACVTVSNVLSSLNDAAFNCGLLPPASYVHILSLTCLAMNHYADTSHAVCTAICEILGSAARFNLTPLNLSEDGSIVKHLADMLTGGKRARPHQQTITAAVCSAIHRALVYCDKERAAQLMSAFMNISHRTSRMAPLLALVRSLQWHDEPDFSYASLVTIEHMMPFLDVASAGERDAVMAE